MTFRSTAFPLWFLFPFSPLPPALIYTMNVNASVIPQEIWLFLNDATVWSHPVSLYLSPHSHSNVNLITFKRGKSWRTGNRPWRKSDVLLKWTPLQTHMRKQKWSWVWLPWSRRQLVYVCVCVCGKKESSWTETHGPQLDMNRYNPELHLTHHSVTLSAPKERDNSHFLHKWCIT